MDVEPPQRQPLWESHQDDVDLLNKMMEEFELDGNLGPVPLPAATGGMAMDAMYAAPEEAAPSGAEVVPTVVYQAGAGTSPVAEDCEVQEQATGPAGCGCSEGRSESEATSCTESSPVGPLPSESAGLSNSQPPTISPTVSPTSRPSVSRITLPDMQASGSIASEAGVSPRKQQRDVFRKLLHNAGWKIVNVKGDGNCQFSSISMQLHKTVDFHKQLRQQAVENIQRNRPFYEQYIVGCTFEDYCALMKKEYTWGDHLTLQALADHLSVNIEIMTATNGKNGEADSRQERHIIRPRKGATTRTLHLAFMQENHYMSIHEEEEKVAGNIERFNDSFGNHPLSASLTQVSTPRVDERQLLDAHLMRLCMMMRVGPPNKVSLFRALIALKAYEGSIINLGSEVITYMERNQEFYRSSQHEHFGAYIASLRSGETLPDHRVVQAVADMMNIEIAVISATKGEPLTSRCKPRGSATPPHRCIYLGCYDGFVYQPVFPADSVGK
eukprot:TRINITY_DN28505_c0_g1_i1.p1 TRINITY_DN28505_c0_g1~~TRINITY_DN28505_c0_g1_i1.p1  ORF type:complete len:520 (+),score=149.03 TRINITY_DN28505_c0_g1_i1:68-1561(+)